MPVKQSDRVNTRPALVRLAAAPRAEVLVCAVLLAWAGAVHAEELVGKVVKIADGDTLTILVDRQAHRVRLTEIDGPEKKQPYGKRSRKSLAELCAGKVATVEDKGRDRYGRILGRVHCDGIYVNAEQVRLHAVVIRRFALECLAAGVFGA